MKIVADSGCEFNEAIAKKYQLSLERVPLTLQLGERQYIDDGTMDIDAYLRAVHQSSEAPKSAAPSPQLFLERVLGSEGSAFIITLSSQLSASYSNAVIAAKSAAESVAGKFVHVFDSLSASVGETLIAMKIDEFVKNQLEEAAVVKKVEEFIHGMKTYFVLDRFDTIVKNGRMSPYVARLASLLSIKPICAGVEGKMEVISKARGLDKALTKLIDIIERESLDFENRVLGISHCRCFEKAVAFKDEILKRIPFKDYFISETSGLCSTYADKGGLIVSC